MISLGILDESRLELLPHKYWASHEFCFFLHDKLVQLLQEYEASGVHNTVRDAFRISIKGKEKTVP